jgi:hypothetical protein
LIGREEVANKSGIAQIVDMIRISNEVKLVGSVTQQLQIVNAANVKNKLNA